MRIEGSQEGIGPSIPSYLTDSLEVRATCALSEFEAKQISYGFSLVAKELEREKANVAKLLRVTAVISIDGEFTVSTEKTTAGEQICFVVYGIQKWRDSKFNNDQIVTIVLEELCHHYWAIRDEIIVKHKVTEIFQHCVKPDITINQLYPGLNR